jgi:hypothetical protein
VARDRQRAQFFEVPLNRFVWAPLYPTSRQLCASDKNI